MHINVVCPRCQKRYQLDPQLEGKNIRCPNSLCGEIIQVHGVIEPEEPGTPTEPPAYQGSGIVPEEIGIVDIPEDNPLHHGRRPPVPGSYSTGKVGDIVPILPAREVPRRPIEPPKGKYRPPPPPPRPAPSGERERSQEGARPEPASREPPARREPPPRRERLSRRERRKRLSDTEELEASPPREGLLVPDKGDSSREGERPPDGPETKSLAESDAGLNWMDAPPPVRDPQDISAQAPVVSPTVSGSPSAGYEPAPYGHEAGYDLPQPSKRRRARWFILTLAALVIVVVGATALLILKTTAASESRRFQSAQKDYADAKYRDAKDKFESLRHDFPKSERADLYDFFTALSEVRDEVYRANPVPEEGLQDLQQLIKHRAGDPLLQEHSKDIWQTYQRSIEDVTTLAEQKLSPPVEADVARRLLSEAQKALEDAKAFASKDQLSEESKKFAERFEKLDQAVTKQERRKDYFAWLKSLPPTAEGILRSERRARQEGLQEDQEVLDAIKRLKDQLISQVSYESSPTVPPSRGVSETAQPGLLVTPRLTMNGGGGNGVALALARGVLYALAEKDGEVLWATRCGVDATRLPVRLLATETAPEMVLVLSSDSNTLTARELQTGKTLWHYDLHSPCLGRPVVINRRAYVPTLDGKVHEIEILTGHLLGWFKLGMPLTIGGAHLPGSNLVYFPADSLNVFVLDVSRQKWSILQSGHPAGTLRSEPILVGGFDAAENNPNASADARLLVLSQADGLGAMRLRAFSLPVEGTAPVSALQPEPRIRGWSWFQPICDGEKIALATDAGVLGLFGLQQQGNDDKPLFSETGQEISLGVSPEFPVRSQVIHMIGDDFWVLANGNLQMLHFDRYRQKLVPIWNRPLALGSPLHDSQVDEKNKTIFTVTQSSTRQACLATAVDFETGQVRWQRQLGMVCQGDPLVLGSEVLAIDQGGTIFRFDSSHLPNATAANWQTGGEVIAEAVENLDGPAYLVHGGDGRSALEVACVKKGTEKGERNFDLLVRHYQIGKNLVEKTFSLGTTRLAGTPGLLNGSVLVPLDDGNLLRQPLDGSKGSFGPGWRARTADEGARGYVIVLSADDFLTTDGSRRLTRWHWPAGDVYKEERRIDLPHRIVSPPAVIRGQKSEVRNHKEDKNQGSGVRDQGSEVRDQKSEASGQKSEGGELVCVPDAAGQARLLRASDLQEIRHWDMNTKEPGATRSAAAARITAGPFIRGNHIGFVINDRRLVWLDPNQDKQVWEYTTPGAEIVGQPQLVGDMIVVADLNGRFIGLDPASGKARLPAGYLFSASVAPAATPRPFGSDRAFVPLTDGTVFFLSLNHLRPAANREEPQKER